MQFHSKQEMYLATMHKSLDVFVPPPNETYSERNCLMSGFAKQSALWDATAIKMVEIIHV